MIQVFFSTDYLRWFEARFFISINSILFFASPKPPRGDPYPNDIYTDLVNHEPQLPRDARLLYKNLGAIRYFIQDPEKADYLIVQKDSRVPNEVSNRDVANAGPSGIPHPQLLASSKQSRQLATPPPPHRQRSRALVADSSEERPVYVKAPKRRY